MTVTLRHGEALAEAVTEAVQGGDVELLTRLLEEHPSLAHAVVMDTRGSGRSLLHLATDFPGHYPRREQTLAVLVSAGSDVNVRFVGFHRETPLHWAASNDDVTMVEALLDAGADIEADGGVIDNGAPLADAVAFGQRNAARALVARGAQANLWQAAALGLLESVINLRGSVEEATNAFWHACHGGRLETAKYLLEQGADADWVGHDGLTPAQAAQRSGALEIVIWLGARRDG